jgi:hypothetical protein
LDINFFCRSIAASFFSTPAWERSGLYRLGRLIQLLNNINMQIKGKITRLFAAQQISDKFRNRKVWVQETEGQYPNTFEVEFTQDKCELLNPFKEGDIVTIDINLRGRYWSKNDKEGVMTSLNGWKINHDVEVHDAEVMNDNKEDLPW